MNQRQIYEQLLAILRIDDEVDVSCLRLDDTPFAAYGIDSLCLMRMLSEIEARFLIEIEEIEIFGATDFSKLTALIEEKLAQIKADSMGLRAVESA